MSVRLPAAVLAAALALGGCGLGPGRGPSNVNLTVTRDFGSTQLGQVSRSKVPGSETVMRMLERSFAVQTSYGGGFVQTIDGYSGSAARRDWFYYVNGIEAPKGAAATAVHRGDRIWWDLHDWSATNDVPAVVGSFPEPFVHGSGGKRYPTTLECAASVTVACTRAADALSSIGVPVANQGLGTGSGQDTLTVLVGTWSELRGVIAAELIQHGPSESGVYARFEGDSLQLLDPKGSVARTLTGDAGLIAATADHGSVPIWLVTGTSPAGVAAAASALTPAQLRDHFALALQGGTEIPLPLDASS